jgi:uncharacterized membrane protein
MARKPTNRGAVAGAYLLAANALCTAFGAGIGALVGAVLPLAALGFFVGFFLGIWVVYRRFRDV